MLRVRGDEVLLPILTTWLLPVRKSRIQLQRSQDSVPARDLIPSTRGAPRLLQPKLARDGHPMSGKSPIPSQNPVQLTFASAGPVQLTLASAGPVQLTFVSAGTVQLSACSSPAPSSACSSPAPTRVRADRAPTRVRADKAPTRVRAA